MRRLAVVVALLSALGGAQGAVASGETNPGDDDPGPGGPITKSSKLTVTPPQAGKITGTGIDCGAGASDCSESFTYTGTNAPVVRLTAARPESGWNPEWSDCAAVTGTNSCDVTVSTLQTTVSVNWVDVVKPTVRFTTAPTRANSRTRFAVEALDGQSGIESVYFFVDRDALPDLSAPYEFRPPASLTNGETYTVEAEARDNGDNWATATHQFTFDNSANLRSFTTNPSLTRCDDPHAAQPDCARPVVAVPPTFEWARAEDTQAIFCLLEPKGGQRHPEYPYESATCTSDTSHTPAIPPNNPDAPSYEGAWRSVIYVRDDLGNVEEYVYEWTLDRRGPSITLPSPANEAVVTAPFTLNPTATDSRAGVAEVRCDPGTGSFGPCWPTHDPPEGRRTIRVRAVDGVGNVRVLERSILYDKTAPQVQITEGPADGAFVDSGPVTFRFSASDAAGPLTTTCKLDQGAFGPCSGGDSQSFADLNPGIHRFTLRVVDAAGHETVVERQFVVPQPTGNQTTTTIINNATTTTGVVAGGAVGGQSETPATAPAPLALAARSTPKWTVRRGRTQVRRLVLSGLVKGAKIQVNCKGRGCAFKKKKLTARGAKANLTKLFKKRKLGARSRIDIKIVFGDGSVRKIRYTTQKGKKKPKVADRTA